MKGFDVRSYLDHHDLLDYDVDGRLLLAGEPIESWRSVLPGPSIVHLPERAAANVRWYAAAFESLPGGVEVFYALKASYQTDVCAAIVESGAGLEVMSERELRLATELGVTGNRLVINGLGRSASFTAASVDADPLFIVLDTVEDVHRTEAAARAAGRRVRVALRLARDAATSAGPQDPGRLGFTWPEEFLAVADLVRAGDHLELTGLLAHDLHHCTDPEEVSVHLRHVVAVLRAADQQHGLRFQVLDIGGGLASRIRVEREGGLSRLVERVATELATLPYQPLVVCEPGRSLVSDAAVGLASFVALKSRPAATWAITDLGTNYLVPVPGSDFVPVPLYWPPGAATTTFHLGDQSCTTSTLCRDVELPIGTREIAVLEAGAYTGVFAHAWGPSLPTVAVLAAGRLRPPRLPIQTAVEPFSLDPALPKPLLLAPS
ncbi:MAG TPA: alanine racemase [Kineosporiaceae bacterium]|nr:alanine racemase [Kineosporiaceae bacterium]